MIAILSLLQLLLSSPFIFLSGFAFLLLCFLEDGMSAVNDCDDGPILLSRSSRALRVRRITQRKRLPPMTKLDS